MAKEKVFTKGESVPEDGEYICVPCGYKKMYKMEEQFEECVSCMSKGKPGTENKYAEGLELWEKIS